MYMLFSLPRNIAKYSKREVWLGNYNYLMKLRLPGYCYQKLWILVQISSSHRRLNSGHLFGTQCSMQYQIAQMLLVTSELTSANVLKLITYWLQTCLMPEAVQIISRNNDQSSWITVSRQHKVTFRGKFHPISRVFQNKGSLQGLYWLGNSKF